MKFQEALDIINLREKGYMVSFERRNDGLLISDYFPDKHADELLIPTVEEAWDLAERFSKATDSDIVNIYVIDNTFSPVAGYSEKMFKKY